MRENMLLQYADDIIKVEIGSLRGEMLRLVERERSRSRRSHGGILKRQNAFSPSCFSSTLASRSSSSVFRSDMKRGVLVNEAWI